MHRKASGMQAVMNEVVKVDYLHEISNTDQKTQTSSHNTDQKTTKNLKKKKISMKSIATTTMAMLESAKKNQEKDSNSASTANTKKRFSMQNSIEDFGIDINKDLLRSVIGKPSNNSFGSMVAGSDTLTINCDVKSSTLFQKCNEIAKEYTSVLYKKNYSWVD